MYTLGELENELDSLILSGRIVEPEVVAELSAFLERLLKLALCFPEYDAKLRELVQMASEELANPERVPPQVDTQPCGVN